MKKLFLSALLALGALLQAAEIPDSQVRPGRCARIGSKTVISATAENTQIVIAPKAPSTVRFAAQELQFFLSRILGKDARRQVRKHKRLPEHPPERHQKNSRP